MDSKAVRIAEYLERKNTTHALLIKGKWGSGKTYYWINDVVPNVVERTVVPFEIEDKEEKDGQSKKWFGRTKEKTRNYSCIYLSLYGIQSIDAFNKELFIQSIPAIGKNRVAKYGITLAGKLFNGLTIPIGNGSLSNSALEGLIPIGFNMQNKVIAIDNLERVSDSIFSDMLGVINSLAEIHGLKVVVLADEEKLKQKESVDSVTKWMKVKEKIVSDEIVIKPDLDSSVDKICNSHLSQDFANFAIKHRECLISAFKRSQSENLRSLIFGLQRFEVFYRYLDKHSRLQDYESRSLIPGLLYFTLALTFELRDGSVIDSDYVQSVDFSSTKIRDMMLMRLMLRNGEAASQDSPQEIFLNKFYFGKESIVTTKMYTSFIAVGEIDNGLLDEIDFVYPKYQESEGRFEKSVVALRDRYLNVLPEEDFVKLFDTVLDFLRRGEVSPYLYPESFSILRSVVLDDILPIGKVLDFDAVQRGLTLSMNNGEFQYRHRIEDNFIALSTDDQVKVLIEMLVRWNSELLENIELKGIEESCKALKNGENSLLLGQIFNIENGVHQYNRSILGSHDFRSALAEMNVTQLADVVRRIEERIEYYMLSGSEKASLESAFVQLLQLPNNQTAYAQGMIRKLATILRLSLTI